MIKGIDHSKSLQLSTLIINEGSSRAGIHHDMPCPFPALIIGQGTSKLVDGSWISCAQGGRLFLADGLVDISYGPTDVVLLDGNIPHGITNLRDLPGQGTASRPELKRFSAILFSDFKREGHMMKHGNYKGMWKEGHEAAVIYK